MSQDWQKPRDIIYKQLHIFHDFLGFTFSAPRRFDSAEMQDTPHARLTNRRLVPVTKKGCDWLLLFASFLCAENWVELFFWNSLAWSWEFTLEWVLGLLSDCGFVVH